MNMQRALRTTGDHWARDLAGIIAAVSAIAYAVGYCSIAVFASHLGIASADLRLGTNDYMFLSLFNIAICTLIAGLVVAATRIGRWIVALRISETPGRSVFRKALVWVANETLANVAILLVCFVAVMAVSAVGAMSSLPATSVGWGWLVVPGVVGLSLARRRFSKKVVMTGLLLLMEVAACLLLVVSSANWGDEMKRNQQGAVMAQPFPMSLIVQPTLGIIQSGEVQACVVRFNEKLVVGRDSILVPDDGASFQYTSCVPEVIDVRAQKTFPPSS
jgi:hypothetical protein